MLKIVKGIFREKNESWEKRKRRRKGNTRCNPKLEDRVLIKGQNRSDAAKGVIDKFMHVCQGPCIINKI
jgi:hypothetical protein